MIAPHRDELHRILDAGYEAYHKDGKPVNPHSDRIRVNVWWSGFHVAHWDYMKSKGYEEWQERLPWNADK